MAQENFSELVHRQFATLVQGFPGEQGLAEFLAAVPIPGTVGPLLGRARVVAEMLRAVPTVEMAIEELRADQDGTRAFYQFAMSQLRTLRETPIAQSTTTKDSGNPFYELSVWALALFSQRLPE